MKITLSGTLKPQYGNPLNLKLGEVRDIIITKQINRLLLCGVIKPVSDIKRKEIIPKSITEAILNGPNTTLDIETKIETNKEIDFVTELKDIKCIGKKTMKDIRRIFDSKNMLLEAIKEDKVPLRDDVVKKIKKFYKIGDN